MDFLLVLDYIDLMFNYFLKQSLRLIIFFQIIQVSIPFTCADELAKFDTAVSDEKEHLFERKKAYQYSSSGNNYNSRRSHHGYSSFGEALLGEVVGELFGTIFFLGIMEGGVASAERMNPGKNIDVIPRDAGEPLIPFLRLDSHYQWVDTDIYALDFRAEGGWGPFAVGIRNTRYKENLEDDTKDELDLLQIEFLYRMSWSKYFEMDIGIGALDVNGEEGNSGTSFSMPVLIYPVKNMGIEFRPTWTDINGNKIRDYDSCLVFRTDYVSIKGGYRVVKIDEESLSGPYVGISFYY